MERITISRSHVERVFASAGLYSADSDNSGARRVAASGGVHTVVASGFDVMNIRK